MNNAIKFIIFLVIFMFLNRLIYSAPNNSQGDIKVIYGRDNRVDAYQMKGSMWEELSKAVAIRVNKHNISEIDFQKVLISGGKLGDLEKLCSDEKFVDQIIGGDCSGFLVSDEYLVTAGHCVQDQDECSNYSWVFDYELKSETDDTYVNVNRTNVYQCAEILSQKYTPDKKDFALIRLDRKVIDRTPLKVRLEGKIEKGASIAVIGHPSGMPKKFADSAKVIENDEELYFSANLDTFQGNSGSPVFDTQTGVVEGILVRGEIDYLYDVVSGCFRVNTVINQCKDGSCQLEDITRINQVERLREIL